MSCKDKDGGTHHYACFCREKFYAEDSKRMIRAFQEIQKVMKVYEDFTHALAYRSVDAICREAIAPREAK